MQKINLFFGLFFLGCTGEKDIESPTGSNTVSDGSGSNDNNSSSNNINCPTSWTQEDSGAWLDPDPVVCAAWSPLSDYLSWYEAVSPSDASNGGCNGDCDEEPNVNYCQDLSTGSYSWRTPTINELQELAQSGILPFDELDVELWSASSDNQDSLAWIINLDQAGMEISIQKTDEAKVRCIAN